MKVYPFCIIIMLPFILQTAASENINKNKNKKQPACVLQKHEEPTITNIKFTGTTQDENVLIRKNLALKPGSTFTWDRFNDDVKRIKHFFLNRGYRDVIVDIPGEKKYYIPDNKSGIEITYRITKNKKYFFGGYSFAIRHILKNRLFTEKQLAALMNLKRGNVFNEKSFQEDKRTLYYTYGLKGYLFVRVNPSFEVIYKKDKTPIILVNYVIKENSPACIEEVIYRGNIEYFRDDAWKIITIRKGEKFNKEKLENIRKELIDLKICKKVNINVHPGDRDNYVKIVLDCK